MTGELRILLATAISIAFIHTLIGVDHYIPFIALSRANNWSAKKTSLVVLVCGIGHVISSIALGTLGIGLSLAVESLVDIESLRGEIATYFLIAFGLVYTLYGVRRAVKNKTHTHISPGGDAIIHSHAESDTVHEHAKGRKSANGFWGLFILFVLGPCEPLIPILMYPAATENTFAVILVTAAFAVCTIATMLLMTILGLKSISLFKGFKLERYSHALAGAAILICGISLYALPI